MENEVESIIKDRIELTQNNTFVPETCEEALKHLFELFKNDEENVKLLEQIQKSWNLELLESYQCVDKLQNTINQYEEELILMMNQMDALVKCSVLIKQYSQYLKEEINKVADKLDREGLDERLDQLVNLLDEIKPKKHLSVVRNTKVLDFPDPTS